MTDDILVFGRNQSEQRHICMNGIPEVVVSDNGPQFAAEAFEEFAQVYSFEHVTSSPYFPQSNGEAERAVKTIKDLLKKEGDPYLSLLSYRSTPLSNGYRMSQFVGGELMLADWR